MKQNRITVFNCVVDKRIEDCEFFEDLLDNHYRKFSFGYNIIARENLLEKVKDVECDILENDLKFIITFKKSITKKIMKLIEEGCENAYGAHKFSVEITKDDDTIKLRIYKK
jgi:hypothetical protein